MSIAVHEELPGPLLVIRVTGKLTKDDYREFVPEFEKFARREHHMRLLFEMDDFHGWDARAAWEDLKLGVAHFSDVDRIAMVGETKWQHGMALFCKPFTRASVKYFDHADAAGARTWLGAA